MDHKTKKDIGASEETTRRRRLCSTLYELGAHDTCHGVVLPSHRHWILKVELFVALDQFLHNFNTGNDLSEARVCFSGQIMVPLATRAMLLAIVGNIDVEVGSFSRKTNGPWLVSKLLAVFGKHVACKA